MMLKRRVCGAVALLLLCCAVQYSYGQGNVPLILKITVLDMNKSRHLHYKFVDSNTCIQILTMRY